MSEDNYIFELGDRVKYEGKMGICVEEVFNNDKFGQAWHVDFDDGT